MFNRVSVWLDEYAPDGGAFADASDWAARLRLPLHAVAAPVAPDHSDPLTGRLFEACAAACARKGVTWDTEFLIGSSDNVGNFFQGSDLSAFGASLPYDLRGRLLSESLHNPNASVMVCAGRRDSNTRLLILHKGPGIGFLEQTVPLCRTLTLPPVILTVARFERRAVENQELARQFFYSRGLDADFDLIAGCDVGTAVARATRVRGCSHVIVQRESAVPWWRRWIGGSTRRLLSLVDRLTLLSLPSGIGVNTAGAAGRNRT